MGAHSYPHIVFATDATTLPRQDLEALLHGLFDDVEPAPTIEHGPLQVILRLGEYAFTFWYDDDAEGLGQRYAEYAPTLKRRRVGRCTTMIDFSGEADRDGAHADQARRLTESLAARSGVYVFSEDRKAFVGMDETDPFAEAPAAAAMPTSPILESPTADSEVTAEPLAPETPVTSGAPERIEPEVPAASVIEPEFTPESVPAALVTEPEPTPEPVPAAPVVQPEPQTGPDPTPEPITTPATGEAEGQEQEPAAVEEPVEAPAPETAPTEEPDRTRTEEPAQTGFFKRLFGRGKR